LTTVNLNDLDSGPALVEGLDSTKGAGADRTFRWAAFFAGLMVLVILALITITTAQAAWPAFSVEYFTTARWVPSAGQFGMLGFLWATLLISFIGILLAVPIAVGIALFATEVAPRRLRRSITTVMDLLASIPSVVFGLVGFYVLRAPAQDLFRAIGDACSGIPVLDRIFGEGSSGTSILMAGIVLSIMILPIITSISREVFDTVPRNDKEGALALGATRAEMINGVVIPHSLGGLTGAVMLGLGRAMGETIAVTLLIGGVSNPPITIDVLSASDAMPSAIARYLSESAGDYRAALIGLGVTLFVVTMVINVLSRKVVDVFDRRIKGAA
jgi:phosphate transport system permease protein